MILNADIVLHKESIETGKFDDIAGWVVIGTTVWNHPTEKDLRVLSIKIGPPKGAK